MKKVNKAAALDWKIEQDRIAKQQEDFDEQMEILRYHGEKLKGSFPRADVLIGIGLPEVAKLVTQAQGLYNTAYYMMRKIADQKQNVE